MGTVEIGPWQLVQQTTVPTQAETQPLDFQTTLSELSRNSEFVQAEDSELDDIGCMCCTSWLKERARNIKAGSSLSN